MGRRLKEGRGAATDHVAAVKPLLGRVAPIRVLVINDQALVREGTVHLLESESDLQVIGDVQDADQGLRLLATHRPDVALVDLDQGFSSGMDFVRQATVGHPETQILVVSDHYDYPWVSEFLEAGVAGYLLKTASAQELKDAVRAVADGILVLDRQVSGLRPWRWEPRRLPRGALSDRQTEVLALLAQGLPNKRIAEELGLGLRTVESNVSMVLRKLGARSRTEATLYALSHHLVDLEEHHPRPGPPDAATHLAAPVE